MLGSVITTETPERIKEICGADGSQCRDYAESPWQDIQLAANKPMLPASSPALSPMSTPAHPAHRTITAM